MKESKKTNEREIKEKEVPAPRDRIQVIFRAESILTVDNTCASLIEQQILGLDQSSVISA
jgi:hypothetical protein